jgi:glycine/D-amino acid oxidase-like deaminating enzyme
MAPAIANGTVVERTACLRPLSADNTPIIGAVPGVQGGFLATGHGRKGILLSLATGRALAELIATGQSTSIDLSPFALERFGIETAR